MEIPGQPECEKGSANWDNPGKKFLLKWLNMKLE